jgi:hypothetical protein
MATDTSDDRNTRDRREGAPPAADRTGAEADRASGAAKTPADRVPNDPVSPPLDGGARNLRHEVRAGPGDAGAQDAPEVLPKTPRTQKATWARIALWLAVPLAILLAIYWAGWL